METYNYKFKVEFKGNDNVGAYAGFKTPPNTETHHRDFGYKIGDEVEVFGWDGSTAEKIIVNGTVFMDEKDRDRIRKEDDQQHHQFMESTLKAKGIYHRIYNPEPL